MNFAELVVDIFALTKPQLNIVDGIVAMQGMGPAAGKPFDLGLILASTDGLALDSYICHMLGKNPLKVPVNKIAYDQGLGEVNIDDIDNLFDMPVIKDFKWPPNIAGTMNRIPEPIMRGLLNLMWTRPVIKEGDCIKCGKCIESCPVNAITDNVVIPDIDYSECINCLCCMEMCPEKAVYLEQSFLEKVISRFA
jgi:ferredoxin